MNEEKRKVLAMVQEGKISVDKAMALFEAIEEAGKSISSKEKTRYFRIRVDGDSVKKVNINIPLKLVKAFSKFAVFGMKYFPEQALQEMEKSGIDLTKLDLEELVDLVEQGKVDNNLVDIDIDDPIEGRIQVRIYVD